MHRRDDLKIILSGALWMGGAMAAFATPNVVGFARFHETAPSAAGGAILYSELGCANCHGGGPGIPERRGPVLAGIVGRARLDWIKRFLEEPQVAKPGTMMPAMFTGPDDPRIEPVLTYLLSLSAPGKTAKASKAIHANGERGSALYHEIGCVACHAPSPDFHPPTGPPKPEEFTASPVALPDLAAKYSLDSLARFLERTAEVRPDGRMPAFVLTPKEAIDIAAHLMDFQASDPREADGLPVYKLSAAVVAEGAEIYASMHCAACHEGGVKVPVRTVPGAVGGCLSGDVSPDRPRYDLTDSQKESLGRYLEEGPIGEPARAMLTAEALNCVACHERDGTGGPDAARTRYFTGDESLGDSGRLPPPLTGIGRKLQPAWLTGVFQGEHRLRPYVMTRMPRYHEQAETLAALFGSADARPDLPALAGGGDMEAGRTLLGTQGGMNCITCHRWGDRASLGIQALDLSELDQRLQPGWFRDYLLNPAGYRAGTLMPPLWPGGQSMIPDVLGGDTERQIASIWNFIAEGEGIPTGYPEVASGAFELVPQDRPIVQRAFLQGVGPYAILVGFPGAVNLAYDGFAGRPAKMWRGRFFDAYSTWFVRAMPFEDPLGQDVLSWAVPADGEEGFAGYRLAKDGTPVFLMRRSGAACEEHFDVIDGKLRRRISWEVAGAAPEPVWTHPEGASVQEDPGSRPGNRVFLYGWKP